MCPWYNGLFAQVPDLENNIFLDQEVYLGNTQNGTKMTHQIGHFSTKEEQEDIQSFIKEMYEISNPNDP